MAALEEKEEAATSAPSPQRTTTTAESWHWEEVELGTWVREWLVLNVEGAVLVETPELFVRCKDAYRDNGECVLHRRKGEFFATYNMDLFVKWHAQQRLGDRVVSEARGRVKVLNFDDTSEECVVEGSWQFRRPAGAQGPLSQVVGEERDVEASDGEVTLRALVREHALTPLAKRLTCLRQDLKGLAEAKKHQLKMPEPQPVPDSDGHGPATRAAAATRELVRGVKAKLRPLTFDVHRDDVRNRWAKHGDFRCMCLTDDDVLEVVDAIKGTAVSKRNETLPSDVAADLIAEEKPAVVGDWKLTSLDLSYNDITDAGLQPLLLALATGSAPDLVDLKLDHTKISDLGRRQFQALQALRKNLAVSFDDADTIQQRLGIFSSNEQPKDTAGDDEAATAPAAAAAAETAE